MPLRFRRGWGMGEDLMDPNISMIFGAGIGAVFSLILTVCYEWLRLPVFVVTTNTNSQSLDEGTDLERKHMQFWVGNTKPHNLLVSRHTARDCKVYVTIRDGVKSIGPYQARWCNSPQPVAPRLLDLTDNGPVMTNTVIFDQAALNPINTRDIASGAKENADLFVLIKSSGKTYFFNNRSYSKNLGNFDNPDFEIHNDKARITVDVVSEARWYRAELLASKILDYDGIKVEMIGKTVRMSGMFDYNSIQ